MFATGRNLQFAYYIEYYAAGATFQGAASAACASNYRNNMQFNNFVIYTARDTARACYARARGRYNYVEFN